MMELQKTKESHCNIVASLGIFGLTLLFGLMIFRSLNWPIIGDAGVFHFIASQRQLGVVPYRDLSDINLPLVYWLHDGIVGSGGLGDFAFRMFDLSVLCVASILVFLFCRPAGWIVAALAALALAVLHLSFGPVSQGQRDFLLVVPALVCALSAVGADGGWRVFVCGLSLGAALLIKPTALALLLVPFAALWPFRLRDLMVMIAGFVVPVLSAAFILYCDGSLLPMLQDWRETWPVYAAFDRQSFSSLALGLARSLVYLAGFVLAAFATLRFARSPRIRVSYALLLFGAIHWFAQGKGYQYHLYPFIGGVVLVGALGLGSLRCAPRLACIALVVGMSVWRGIGLLRAPEFIPGGNEVASASAAASRAMHDALVTHFQKGARVQLIDSDAGGFLAMARAGMRQATPYAYWFILNEAPQGYRERFIDRLRRDPPEGFLVTNTQWPAPLGFSVFENWRELRSLISDDYALVASSSDAPPLAWRLYKQK